jgi:hypothetical protein
MMDDMSRAALMPTLLLALVGLPDCAVEVANAPGDAPALCPDSPPDLDCRPLRCTTPPCGGLGDPFDADGCPRPKCDADQPCDADRVCYRLGDWGACGSSHIACEDGDDGCFCTYTLDCNYSVAYCVPAELAPPTNCNTITSADACIAAGCSAATTIIPVTLGGHTDTCACGEPQVACLWFQDKFASTAKPTPYYHLDAMGELEVALFPDEWVDPPHGWGRCSNASAPPACACADTCAP